MQDLSIKLDGKPLELDQPVVAQDANETQLEFDFATEIDAEYDAALEEALSQHELYFGEGE